MSRIYASAQISLVPAASKCSDQGFLNRKVPPILPVPFVSSREPNLTGTIYLQERLCGGNTSAFNREVQSQVWYDRGWTFQELLVSRRLLYFGDTMLHYSCQTAVGAENTKAKALTEDFYVPWVWRHHDNAKLAWFQAVQEYSGRLLSNPTDKLPAISALAYDIHQACGSQYLAGLWKDSLVLDLLWVCLGSSQYYSSTTPKKSEIYRAPSWSWASGDGTVSWIGLVLNIDFAAIDKFLTPQAAVVESSTTLLGDNPFGGIMTSTLTLQGKLQHSSIGRSRFPHGFTSSCVPTEGDNEYPLVRSGHDLKTGVVTLDWSPSTDLLDQIHTQGAWLLLLAGVRERRQNYREHAVVGLVLVPSQHDVHTGYYERVGLFTINVEEGQSYFHDCVEQAVMIV
jgi:hypothetical protein